MKRTKGTPREMKRSTRRKESPGKRAYNLERCEALLQNIYWNGFEDHRGPFRVSKGTLRELFGVEKFHPGELESLARLAKRAGFVMCPLDQIDHTRAREWIFDSLKRLSRLPVVDEDAISRAQSRADEAIG